MNIPFHEQTFLIVWIAADHLVRFFASFSFYHPYRSAIVSKRAGSEQLTSNMQTVHICAVRGEVGLDLVLVFGVFNYSREFHSILFHDSKCNLDWYRESGGA
jgi:hypothetical protein